MSDLFQMLADGFWLVKCQIDHKTQKFVPIVKPPTLNGAKTNWTEAEDSVLKDLVLYKGSTKWTKIAEKLNETLYNGEHIRSAKHCRERWINSIDPGLKCTEWAPDEDHIIISSHKLLGNKWSAISKLIPGRTENQVKNRWRCIQRKVKKFCDSDQTQVFIEIGGEVGKGDGFDFGFTDFLGIDEILPGKYYEEPEIY